MVLVHPGPAGVGLQGNLVKAIGDEAVLILQVLGENPKDLAIQVGLGYAVALVLPFHGPPAQVLGG